MLFNYLTNILDYTKLGTGYTTKIDGGRLQNIFIRKTLCVIQALIAKCYSMNLQYYVKNDESFCV